MRLSHSAVMPSYFCYRQFHNFYAALVFAIFNYIVSSSNDYMRISNLNLEIVSKPIRFSVKQVFEGKL
jgi:hypothetical protein